MSGGSRADAVRSIEDQVGVLVRRVKRTITERAQAIHADLQGPSYLVLSWLAENGPVRASAIAEVFGTDKGALSRQLHYLEQHGLVERTRDPADGRATLVSASTEAVRRLDEVDGQRRLRLCERLSEWPVAELEAFADQLARYNNSLD